MQGKRYDKLPERAIVTTFKKKSSGGFKVVGKANKPSQPYITIASPKDLEHRSWKYFYHLPPVGDLSLENFELFAFERLKLLRSIDNWRARGLKFDEIKGNTRIEDKRLYGDTPDSSEKDWISHHVLRLAFSQTEQLRRWFLQQESTLFEVRLATVHKSDYASIISVNGLSVQKVDNEEYQQVEELLEKLVNNNREKPDTSLEWFKVPFTEVLSLVGRRRVLLKGGMAYLSTSHLTSLIGQQYKTKLGEALNQINQVWPYLEDKESDRLVPLLKSLANKSFSSYSDKNMKIGNSKQVYPEQIDTLAAQSFPMCMKILHRKLRENHHLKHLGRQQYGLFLKGIGLSLEDALRFWREEFTKIITVDKFEKDYAYNIRHSYGKEGKRTNYAPYSCNKIISGMSTPGVGEYHGCPFKTLDADNLRVALKVESNGVVTGNDAESIIDLCKKQHYQLACRRFFELTHPNASKYLDKEEGDLPFQHPNMYYRMSRRIYEAEGVSSEQVAKQMPAEEVISEPVESEALSKPVEPDTIAVPHDKCEDDMEH